MLKLGLQIRAYLDGVTGLEPEDSMFRWYFKLKCIKCGEMVDKWHYITMEDSLPTSFNKIGTPPRRRASSVVKCKLCSTVNSIDMMEGSTDKYTVEDSGQFKTIVVMDCRGMEPVEFSPRNGWKARGWREISEDEGEETGTDFTDVDLTEGDWAGFDQSSNTPAHIADLEYRFVKVKKQKK